jgi:hypothetical protein
LTPSYSSFVVLTVIVAAALAGVARAKVATAARSPIATSVRSEEWSFTGIGGLERNEDKAQRS